MCLCLNIYQRLAAGEWFTARVSSCGLFHIAYPSAPEMLKTELRSIYGQLCQDDMPMVRRSAATNLGKFAATIEPAHLKTDIMTIFEDLTQDGNICICYLSVVTFSFLADFELMWTMIVWFLVGASRGLCIAG